MRGALGLFRWVRSRRSVGGPGRWLARLALGAWKAARLLPLADRVCVNLTVDGHAMRVRLFSYDDLLTASEDYEPSLAAILPREGGVAIDAGAFIGRHTLAYARAVGPRGRVVAVEALPANFGLLQYNVRRNGYQHATCVGCALGRDSGRVWLAYERETSTASTTRELARRVEVDQRPLDDVLRDLGVDRIDLLKIDVEGAELEVLEGAGRVLAASPAARLVIEIHPWATDPDGRPLVDGWLAERGYQVRRLQDGQRLYYLAQRAS